jgi:hypothetical protein
MTSAKLLRRQAATCAALARQTHDEDSRRRYLHLERTYLHLAQAEEQPVARMSAPAAEAERKPAA